MSPRPLVSVVIPLFNAAPWVGPALRSLRRQTLGDWEGLVMDDGSTDGSADIAEATARQDPRLRVVRLGRVGLVEALNRGVAAAAGTFVARMDADDVMTRDRLARQVAVLDADPGLSLVGCGVRQFPRRLLTPRRREYEDWLNATASEQDITREAFVECPLAHPTWMARADLLRRLPYRDVGWPEDYDLLLRAIQSGHRLGTVHARLLAWREHPVRLSRVDPRYTTAQFTACKAAYLASGFLASTDLYVLWGYGDTGRSLRRALLEYGKVPSAIVEVKRGRIGQRIHGARVLAVDELPHWPRQKIVVSVARHGPRTLVRIALAAMGFVELRDFVCAA